MIPASLWSRYRAVMKQAHDSFSQDILVWVRHNPVIMPFQEQEQPSGNRVELRVLIGYNFFRTWPITKHSSSGAIDNQNMLVFVNKDYLQELGYLNSNGYLNFTPERDYFVHRGIRYKAEGDTFLSQAHDNPLHIQFILHREETLVGDTQYNDPTTQPVIEEVQEDILYLVNYDLR
jgi:hypothetical protein